MSETTKEIAPTIKTRILVVSDTHGLETPPDIVARQHADVAIHCGDLTTGSLLDEFKASIRYIQALNAPLKLVMAGNHDFTMDIPVFQKKVNDTKYLDQDLIHCFYGSHSFRLENGALLNVYTSPYTPSYGDWGFQYKPDDGHDYQIDNADLVMTHGPPKGIMDRTRSGERAGSTCLFTATAQHRPLMHCFGHIHEGWGAKLVKWRDPISAEPSHLTDIDNEKSMLISNLASVSGNAEVEKLVATSHCPGDLHPLQRGSDTPFVNASVEGSGGLLIQPSWLVNLELPAAV
ncbi:unnamed protein product [Penicillium salamii]|uniref:Calcineurin-like phosphoesterase domain-containing protein n=1 Tax=Penicillium salamii TaxID=1612424 RepID=A0A9W4NZH1_9EURO|nr:unnamed protein product [Penicillium salamii]